MRRKERSLLSPGTGCLWVLVDQCNSLDHEKRAKLSLFRLLKFPNQQFKCSGYVGAYRLYKQTQTLNRDLSGHLQQVSPGLKPVFATIEKFRWFSGVPSPLNGMVGGNHWKRWISDDVLGQATIGNDGFQWLSTICPTME